MISMCWFQLVNYFRVFFLLDWPLKREKVNELSIKISSSSNLWRFRSFSFQNKGMAYFTVDVTACPLTEGATLLVSSDVIVVKLIR